jgi:uncharacterized protein (TIGR03083 family)
MMTVVPDGRAVREAFKTETDRVTRLLNTAARLDDPVPQLDWSIRQLAAHMCVVYQSFASTVRGEFPMGALDGVVGPHGTMPEMLARANAFAVQLVDFPDASAAAETIGARATEWLEVLDGDPDPLEACPTPWYGPKTTRTIGTLAALAVSETLVHGQDMARAIGAKMQPSASSAAAVAPTVMSEMLPLLLDTERADGFDGSFEIRVRGGVPFVLHIADGKAWSTPAGEGEKADCIVSLEPRAALMMGFGRQSVGRSVLTGGSFAFGRKPWLGMKMLDFFLTP